MFGGMFSKDQLSRETWLWRCGAWQQLHPAQSPPALQHGQAAAYDPVHAVVVLFDMDTGTWTFDGTTWARQGPSTGQQLYSPEMVWDSTRRQIVLVGDPAEAASNGNSMPPMLTYTWNGTTWQQRSTPVAPDWRDSPVLLDDPHLHRVILVAGRSTNAGTWTWDGTQWVGVAGPAPTGYATGAYSSAVGFAVVVTDTETWTWNGRQWSPAQPRTQPPFVWYRQMSFDAATGLLLLFGGIRATDNQVTTDLWTYGSANTSWTLLRGASAMVPGFFGTQ